MKSNCKHCRLSCKTPGLTNCKKEQPKYMRPEQLKIEIREAFKIGDYEKGRKLQEELFKFNNG